MPRGLSPQISPNEQRSEGRTLYEAPGWGNLSTEDIEAMRGRIAAACPDLAHDVKIRSMEADLVIEIPSIATDEQIARLHQWLHGEAALREDLANQPTDGRDGR
jgi:hypothetical protein